MPSVSKPMPRRGDHPESEWCPCASPSGGSKKQAGPQPDRPGSSRLVTISLLVSGLALVSRRIWPSSFACCSSSTSSSRPRICTTEHDRTANNFEKFESRSAKIYTNTHTPCLRTFSGSCGPFSERSGARAEASRCTRETSFTYGKSPGWTRSRTHEPRIVRGRDECPNRSVHESRYSKCGIPSRA